MASEAQINNFVTEMRTEASQMRTQMSRFHELLQEWQKLAYNASLIDKNVAGENQEITGSQIDLAVAAMADFLDRWNSNPGTYLLSIAP